MPQAVTLVPTHTAARTRCRLCDCKLGGKGDDLVTCLCLHCLDRPEAAAIRSSATRSQVRPAPRDFTVADKELIRRIHVHLPAAQLLSLLNERLRADHGEASPYTLEQLNAHLRTLRGTASTQDWANLRKIVRDARAEGVAQCVTAQMINDFAVVFSLTPAQVHRLRDVLLCEDTSES
jgi:hypothetical protein